MVQHPYDRRAIHFDAATALAEEGEADDASIRYLSAEAKDLGLPANNTRPGARAEIWVERLYSYELHWVAEGRAPREHTRDLSTLPGWERRLGEWARYQRRFDRELSKFQRLRLDRSPAFDWDPNEAAWDRALNAAIQIVVREQRLPYLNGNDRSEFVVARWLGRQLRLRKAGALSKRRETLFDALLSLARSAR
ncbi:hypothetical protein ACFQ9V_13390 [Leifsonia sp. NPDC056665]|uniref:hypothetical protein n=1 Tax=Leifsonia sp. NPDC056665 TaxID=3345901 RepID=UPI00368E6881